MQAFVVALEQVGIAFGGPAFVADHEGADPEHIAQAHLLHGTHMAGKVRELGGAGLPVAGIAIVGKAGLVGKPAVVGQPGAEAEIGGEAGVAQHPLLAHVVVNGGPGAEDRVVGAGGHRQVRLGPFRVDSVAVQGYHFGPGAAGARNKERLLIAVDERGSVGSLVAGGGAIRRIVRRFATAASRLLPVKVIVAAAFRESCRRDRFRSADR